MLYQGDLFEVLPTLPESSADSCVTDPPYGLGFMGKEWDTFSPHETARRVEMKRRKSTETPVGMRGRPGSMASASVEHDHSRGGHARFGQWCRLWAGEVLRVLKPGGYMACFGGTRTYHRLACAVEDAGFEIRDCVMWLHGQGFPKGRGCLKPAYEPILLARKPGPRVLPLGIDECRVELSGGEGRERNGEASQGSRYADRGGTNFAAAPGVRGGDAEGRWPANVLHDGSAEVLEAFPDAPGQSGAVMGDEPSSTVRNVYRLGYDRAPSLPRHDEGSAARFFYCAKASRRERDAGLDGMPEALARRYGEQGQGPLAKQTPRTAVAQRNTHPTVKPLELMLWLVRLVTPPGGVCLDPFAGSGTTGVACVASGRRHVLVEREPDYCAVIRRRLAEAAGPLFATKQPAQETLAAKPPSLFSEPEEEGGHATP